MEPILSGHHEYCVCNWVYKNSSGQVIQTRFVWWSRCNNLVYISSHWWLEKHFYEGITLYPAVSFLLFATEQCQKRDLAPLCFPLVLACRSFAFSEIWMAASQIWSLAGGHICLRHQPWPLSTAARHLWGFTDRMAWNHPTIKSVLWHLFLPKIMHLLWDRCNWSLLNRNHFYGIGDLSAWVILDLIFWISRSWDKRITL